MSNPYERNQRKNSVLGPTLRFKGELSADEELLIQGKVEGTIKHSSNLTIGREGKLKADVSAEYIAIEGEVRGDLVGSKSVVVRDSANVDGNIHSPVVTLLEGAKFNGSIDMSGKLPAAKSDNAEDNKSNAAPQSVASKSKPDNESENAASSSKKKPHRSDKKPASAA